ncbi:MAG: MerR family transcriptional regulator [Clostridia bacterium]|nr:MerR family transcriptional regulator [Clostridia bacterium]
MPDVRNCRRCGKIYNYIGGAPICPVCREMDEEDFKKVKEYLYKNPGATLSEVSTVLEISVEKIKGYLKEGRLEIINNEGNLVLECESCGKAIKTGRFCDECSKGLAKDFQSTASQMSSSASQAEAAKKSIGMRYLNKDIKK